MTKRVYITVHGEHTVDGVAQEPVEVKTEGRYYCRGGKHYLLYDEYPEGGSAEDPPFNDEEQEKRIRSLVKFNGDSMEVSRSGGTDSRMLFEKDRLHMTQYRTASGVLELGVEARAIELEETANRIRVQVDYTMYAGGSKVQDSRVTVTVIPYPVL